MRALQRADALVMVQPCGRSSSIELGFAAGAGLPTVVLLAPGEPELMLSLADVLCTSVEDVIAELTKLRPGDGRWRQGKCMGCREVMGPDGSCQCAGHYRECDTMRAPYQGPPCRCWACTNRRAGAAASKEAVGCFQSSDRM